MKWTQFKLNRAEARFSDGVKMPLATKEQRQAALDRGAEFGSHLGVYLNDVCVDVWETCVLAGDVEFLPLLLLNTSILTAHGEYKYTPLTLAEVKTLLAEEYDGQFVSFIGHDAAAAVMSDMLDAVVPVNRAPSSQLPGQEALVFKLNGRLPEGKILTREETEAIGFTWGLLKRLS